MSLGNKTPAQVAQIDVANGQNGWRELLKHVIPKKEK
jgi:hypothetical protein